MIELSVWFDGLLRFPLSGPLEGAVELLRAALAALSCAHLIRALYGGSWARALFFAPLFLLTFQLGVMRFMLDDLPSRATVLPLISNFSWAGLLVLLLFEDVKKPPPS